MSIPTIDSLFSTSKKRSQMELSKALACMGFGAWNDLEPTGKSEAQINRSSSVKSRQIRKKSFVHINKLPKRFLNHIAEMTQQAVLDKWSRMARQKTAASAAKDGTVINKET